MFIKENNFDYIILSCEQKYIGHSCKSLSVIKSQADVPTSRI